MDSAACNPRQEGGRIRPIKRACIDCHARKVRCDGAANGFPCSHCRTASVECIVAQRRKRKRASETNPSPVAGQTGLQQEGALVDQAALRGAAPNNFPASRLTTPENGDGTRDNDARPEETAEYAGEYELARQHLVEFFSQDLQGNPIRARSTYVGSELSNLNYLTRQRASNQHVHHYPCSNIYVPREFRNKQVLAAPNLIPKDAFVLPPKHVSDVLVADYFSQIHPMLPIIDRDKFMSQYNNVDSSPAILLLHAVCLAGSHVTKTYRKNHELKVACFRRAKALLDGRYEEDRMNVVQAALLMTWFSDGGDDICANAWWWIGTAARTAIGLGMHREVGPSKMPLADQRIWKMIWWCLVQFDCLVSLCYGRPQNINLDDCDVPPLILEDFDGSVDKQNANALIHLTGLCATMTNLIRSHFSVRAAKSGITRVDAVKAVDEALAAWIVQLPPSLREQSGKSTAGSGHIPSLMVHLMYNSVLIQVHRTLSLDQDTDSRAGDREICAEAASHIIWIFERLDHASGLRHCAFWAPSALFTAMLEISGQQKYMNPILALRSKEKYNSGLKSLRRLAKYWLFATSVLRLFESNIKTSREMDNRGSSTNSTDHVSPDQESPLARTGSIGRLSGNSHQAILMNSDPSQQHTMDWVQLLPYNDPNTTNMHMENNRWQQSIEEWQSLYWSDPLDNIRLDDNFGQFQFDWPQ